VYTPQFICLLVLVVATVLFTSLYFVTNMKYLDLDLGFVRSRNSAKIFQNFMSLTPSVLPTLGQISRQVWKLEIKYGQPRNKFRF
jgi:ABC-type sugar transport system permease subunit